MKCYKFFNGIFILVILFLSACGTATIKTQAIPDLKIGSPLSGIKPVTFFIKKFRDEAGEVVHMSGFHGVVKTDKPANQLFSQAIAAELKRNGHKVLLNESDGKADIIIDGTVKKFLIEVRMALLGTKYIGYAEAEITVTKTSDATESIQKLYRGSYESGKQLGNPHIFDDRWRTFLYETLSNMVNDFSTDQDLFTLLKRLEEVKHVPH